MADKDGKAHEITKISSATPYLAIAAIVISLLSLASLHILSPEFDPSWRMVSEYANGHYGWVLSLMFASWGVSTWFLFFAIRQHISTKAGKAGLILLVVAGVGEAMASVFDINHPLHGLAGILGVAGLPVAAMLISVHLSRTPLWSKAKKIFLWTANLTWISVVVLAAAFAIMIYTYTQTGAKINPEAKVIELPAGVVALVGWANRFLVLVYYVWVVTVAWQAIQLRQEK